MCLFKRLERQYVIYTFVEASERQQLQYTWDSWRVACTQNVNRRLKGNLKGATPYLRTDSWIALCCIHSQHRHKSFTSNNDHVKSTNNLADVLSKGTSPEKFPENYLCSTGHCSCLGENHCGSRSLSRAKTRKKEERRKIRPAIPIWIGWLWKRIQHSNSFVM